MGIGGVDLFACITSSKPKSKLTITDWKDETKFTITQHASLQSRNQILIKKFVSILTF